MSLPKNFWNKYFEVYDILNMVIPYQKLLDKVIKSLNVQPNDIILDAGCGTGNLSIKLIGEYRNTSVFGIDSSTEAIKRFLLKLPNAKVINADLTKKLPFETEYFNKIACVNVFYALPKEKRGEVLGEFNRILKSGGTLVMTNPINKNPSKIYYEHLSEEFKNNNPIRALGHILLFIPATLKMFYYNSKIVNKLGHTFLSKEEQKELLTDHGFEKIEFNKIYSDQSLEVIAFKGHK